MKKWRRSPRRPGFHNRGDGPGGQSRSRRRSCLALFCGAIGCAGALLAGGWSPNRSSPAVHPAPGWQPPRGEGCTIAVLTGKATRDGRPILWKNRDAGDLENEVVYFSDGRYRYVALLNAGATNHAWIGVNERGFAILNALSYNLTDSLPGGLTNGALMKQALQSCADTGDFEALLRETDLTGRENPANFAVIDASGGAKIYEAAAHSFTAYDANDPAIAPEGFLTRANFSLSGDTTHVDTYRYNRCRRLLEQALAAGGVDKNYLLETVACDISNADVTPYPLPYSGAPSGRPDAVGYVDASETINRRWSVAGGAIQGVLPDEDPLLSTFYAVVSQPVLTVPLPVWVAGGRTPRILDGDGTSPLCDLALKRARLLFDYPNRTVLLNTRRLVDGSGQGFLTQVRQIEDWLFPETEAWLARWRARGVSPEEMGIVESRLAEDAFAQYQTGARPDHSQERLALHASPNPMHGETRILYDFPEAPSAGWTLGIFDVAGREVARLGPSPGEDPRRGVLLWDGRDASGAKVPTGTYYLRTESRTAGGSILVIR